MAKKKKYTKEEIEEIKERNAQNAKDVGEALIKRFAEGNVHKKASYIFLKNSSVPAQSYSLLNQMLVFLVFGCEDARGFHDWKKVGRYVKKGSKADAIIRYPKFRKNKVVDNETGELEDEKVMIGTGWAKIFDISSTDGEPLPPANNPAFLEDLPLIELARHAGIEITLGKVQAGYASFNQARNRINMNVTNAQTWLHELSHWADKEVNGKLKGGQNAGQEIVAEFSAAILMECLGKEVEDKSSLDYIKHYANTLEVAPEKACDMFLSRAVKVVSHLLTLSGQLASK